MNQKEKSEWELHLEEKFPQAENTKEKKSTKKSSSRGSSSGNSPQMEEKPNQTQTADCKPVIVVDSGAAAS